LIVAQKVKFPAFNENPRLITVSEHPSPGHILHQLYAGHKPTPLAFETI